jgi:hypothetical protein
MSLGNLSLSAISMRSPKILVCVPSFSDVGQGRLPMLQTRRMFNRSWRVLWRFHTEISTSDAIWSTDFLLSLLTTSSFICWRWWATTTRIVVNTLASIMEVPSHTPEILSFVPLHAFAATWLITSLVISTAKRKIWHPYVVHLLIFSTGTLPKETSNYHYAFRGYEMAKLFLRWRYESCQPMRQNFLHAATLVNYTSEFRVTVKLLGTSTPLRSNIKISFAEYTPHDLGLSSGTTTG